MSSSININVPATITSIAGQSSLSSLAGLPTSLAVADSASGANITLALVAANINAAITASATGGASLVSSGNTLQISGSAAQVNAVLASLSVSEPSGVTSDIISLTAQDNKGGLAQSGFALAVVPQAAPAFVAPAKLVTLSANQPLALPDLLLSDPTASALAAMGLGAEETLQLTLAVSAGALLLPDYSALTGISADGIGTGTIHLTLSANDIGALNTLLTSLEFAGPSLTSGQHLTYDLWNHDGVLPREVTSGNIYLNTVGPAASAATYALGTQTLVTGVDTLSGILDVTGTFSALGNLVGNGAVSIAPGGVLELPYNSALFGGTSYDFGTFSAQDVVESGQLLIGGTASLQGELALNTNAFVDFAGGLTVDTGAANDFQEGITLASGAVLEGSGTLSVGDFSASGMIDGTGTILALQGETLEIDAGLVSSGVNLDVAGGGVMVLGPVAPLFGIFNTTPLTVQSGVTLNFEGAGSQPITGGYANPLGGTGGAFVISGPQVFSGTVSGFAAGDELIFPGLTGLVVHNISTIAGASSFVVSGVDANGTTQSYTIFSNIPAGLVPAASFDTAGDATVVLHSNLATVTSNGGIAATAGVAQPLMGINVVLAAATTQSLTITLSSAHGSLSAAGFSPAATLTLTASNLSTLNAELASVSYTGTGVLDVLTISSGTGILAGLQSFIAVDRGGSGTVNGYSGLGFTEAELVSFGSTGGLYVDDTAHALGGVLVTGQIEFNDGLIASGFSGTALQIDNNGNAIFGAAANAVLSGDVVVGDTNGSGALEVLTTSASIAGNLTLAAAGGGAGSSLAVMGALSLSGAALVGLGGAATIYEAGSLAAGSLNLGTLGTLQAYGTAAGHFGGLSNSGAVSITGSADITATSYSGTGGLTLGGAVQLNITGAASFQAGQGFIGTDARLAASTFAQSGGAITIAGRLAASGSATLTNASFAGGELSANLLDVAGALAGYGIINASTVLGTGTILAEGGRLLIAGGNFTGSFPVEIATGATLELSSADLSSTPVSFTGTSALLVVDDAATGLPGIAGMSSFDAVDLVGIAPSLVSIAPGMVEILNSQGSIAQAFAVATSGTALPGLAVSADGSGGSLITMGGELPCYARGTSILTPQGYRPVETLRPGDPVINAAGERRPVRWVGWRTMDLGLQSAKSAKPVIIMPGAFGPGKPFKMLRLSPLHCVYAQGVLIPVVHLINGATILRDETSPAMTYYHLELDRHDIMLAEGLECESYFCNANRGQLYHELGRRTPARRPFAPNITSGARLAAVRRYLHELALKAGFTPGYMPRLRAVSGGMNALPRFSRHGNGHYASFSFAEPVRSFTLLSPASSPADTNPDSEDRRELGLCLGEMRGLTLGQGWLPRAAGDAGIWMSRQAEISLARARRQIRLPVAAVPQNWLRATPLLCNAQSPASIDAPRATS
ncbi:MAG: Hint domain-containing protein [Rhodospirillales bacterium]|nr:Hint domain-containing protein [Rhodospirillales bacterium]